MMMKMKEKVAARIVAAPKVKVGRRVYRVLDHKAILNLSATPDVATRRLREMVNVYGDRAFELKGGYYFYQPKFVNWVRKTQCNFL